MTTARRLIALISVLLLVPLLAVTQTPSASATDDALFRAMPGFRPSGPSAVRPVDYRSYRVDLAGVRAALAGGGTRHLSIPDPAGTPTDLTLVEDSVMAPSMQAAHPDIRTYRGTADHGASVRLDVTPLGFHAMVRRPDGVVWYVEPATRAVGESRVLSFAGAAAGEPGSTFVEQEVRRTSDRAAAEVGHADLSTPGGLVSQRTYRLALVTDPAYAAYVAPGASTHAASDPLVLAAKTTLINRVNEAYNDDVAYRFTLIAGTDTRLNLLTTAEMSGAHGPCGANACFPGAATSYDCGSLLERNAFALGMLVGANTFDLGHIGVGVAGGGIAGLGVVGTAAKAMGCTGVPTPVGDVYAIDYVAHEMGHQMGADHTFNGVQSSCGGNGNPQTAVEPGSGVTIMAYAGICSSDNLQPHSDPYFSFHSIQEFEATTAASPAAEFEQQVVALNGFDGADSFTLTGSAGTSSPVVHGSSYNAGGLASAVLAASGSAAIISGYDGAGAPSADGFTVSWGSTSDQQTLTVTPVAGASSARVGTIVNGGPDTNGGTVTVTTDHAPVVTAPASRTIPTRTPFTLTGSATDSDGDTLTYLWEQTDHAVGSGTGLVDDNKTNGPLFRVFGTYADVSAAGTIAYHSPGENLAGTDPSRTFPDQEQVAAGNTNAKTGTCPAPANGGTVPVTDPALNCFSEFLPTSDWVGTGDRVMHFRLTARDEFAADGAADHAGGASWADTALTVDDSAGPFLVTSRATAGAPAAGGGSEDVTWDVAGTNTAPLAPNVRISLSTDGGLTFPIVLASSTPNDGSESVTLPDLSTTTARIRIEAVDNYFFALNDADFAITGNNVAPTVDAGPDAAVIVSQPFVSSGTFTDDDPSTATATVDYGDGSGIQPLPLAGSGFHLDHTYDSAGARTVTVTVTDSQAVSAVDSAQVTVNANLAPVVDAGPDGSATTGVSWISSGSFTDELPDFATATVDYGDGAGPVPLTPVQGTFSLSHVYSTTGAKTVTVTVTDSGTMFGTDTATVTVVVPSDPAVAASVIKASARPRKIFRGRGFKAVVTVTCASGRPTGTVQVYQGRRLLGTGTLSNGKVRIKVPKRKARRLKVGKVTLTAKYLGSATVAASRADFKLRVKRR